MAAMFLKRQESLEQLRIANFIRIEIHDRDTYSVFHFACAKIMQEWPPLLICFEIFGDMLGKEDVAGVSAIHHPLRHVEASTGEIGMTIYIYHPAHRTAVHPHPEL